MNYLSNKGVLEDDILWSVWILQVLCRLKSRIEPDSGFMVSVEKYQPGVGCKIAELLI